MAFYSMSCVSSVCSTIRSDGHPGSNVYFDHIEEKVEVTFNRNGDEDGDDCNDVKLLSGGLG